jgi:hypothetical protein
VQSWADVWSFDYRWIGDELFDCLSVELASKVMSQRVVASDLARLIVLQEALEEGFERVIWLDADVLVTDPAGFEVGSAEALFGREVWVQATEPGGKLKTYRKVHNAFMAFCAGEPVLPFYRMSAERILSRYDEGSGPMVAQLVGPKLITLLHNAIGFDVQEDAGVVSPLVARDLLQGGGSALDRFRAASPVMPRAANLCGSSVREGALADADMERLIDRLEATDAAGGVVI